MNLAGCCRPAERKTTWTNNEADDDKKKSNALHEDGTRLVLLVKMWRCERRSWETVESTSVEDHIWPTHTHTHTPTDDDFSPVTCAFPPSAPRSLWWSPLQSAVVPVMLLTPGAAAANLRPIACTTVWFNGREREPWTHHPAPTSAIQRCGRGTPLSRYSATVLPLPWMRVCDVSIFTERDVLGTITPPAGHDPERAERRWWRHPKFSFFCPFR